MAEMVFTTVAGASTGAMLKGLAKKVPMQALVCEINNQGETIR